MPVDARLKAFVNACAPLAFALLILAGTSEETPARTLRTTVHSGPVQKGSSLGVTAPKGPVKKGPALGWCATHPSHPRCTGRPYPCPSWNYCPPVKKLPYSDSLNPTRC